MSDHQQKNRLALRAIFVFMAMVIMLDFILPGKIVNDEIIHLKRERQQYYNAASNHHYSYKLTTNKHQFFVAEDFVESAKDVQRVEYSVSRIFKEVNWYRLPSSENRAVYSLRIVTGLVLPLLTIVSILVAFLFRKNIGTLIFVLQACLIADMIFVMM